ncbi:hypothetical protein LJK88_11230 [Paenibacillus sp. P26]|nr:hypothetical protein LJK88_11230 [Paenibacillus sp. P26]
MKQSAPISVNLQENRQWLEQIFANCRDIIFIPWNYGSNLQYAAMAVYCTTLVQEKKENYFKTVMQDLVPHQVGPASDITPADVINFFKKQGLLKRRHIRSGTWTQRFKMC